MVDNYIISPMRNLDTIASHIAGRPHIYHQDPAQFGRLVAYYDCRYPFGKLNPPALTDFLVVPTWIDLSGNGMHAAQATSSKQPVIRTTQSVNLIPYGPAIGHGNWSGNIVNSVVASNVSGITSPANFARVVSFQTPSTGGPYTGGANHYSSDASSHAKVVGGQTYTSSVYVMPASGGVQRNAYITIRVRRADGTETATQGGAQTMEAAYGTWTRLSVTFTIPADGVTAFVQANWTNMNASETHYVSGAQIELGSTASAWSAPYDFVGLPTIQFDGIDDMFVFNNMNKALPNTSGTVYVVGRNNIPSATGYLFSANTNSRIYMQSGSANPSSVIGNPAVTLPTLPGGKLATRGVYTLSWDAANATEYFNNTSFGTTGYTTDSGGGSFLALGGHSSGSGPHNGDLACVLVYADTHTATQMSKISNWLASQFAFSLS